MTSAQQHRRASIPPIPDLRFETAYLSKIRPFVHFEQVPALREASDDFENDDVLYGNEGEQPARDVLEIDWKNVFWVTFRDQVLTMWVQGALWAIIGFYLRPIYTQAGQRFKRKEGGAVSWLRNWVKELGLSASTDRAR